MKKRAKKFELASLLELKGKKAKSKMKNLTYSQLQIQDYLLLKTINISEAKALFKFRLRMAPFGENFRGGQKTILCPLCEAHPDGQRESFDCIQLKEVINVKGDYNKIFSQVIPHDIYTFREELRKMSGENQQVSRRGPRAHNCGAAVVT